MSHFLGAYTDDYELLSIYFVSEPLLSCSGSRLGLMNRIHWPLSFHSQNTSKSRSTFRGFSAISVSFLIGPQGLDN